MQSLAAVFAGGRGKGGSFCRDKGGKKPGRQSPGECVLCKKEAVFVRFCRAFRAAAVRVPYVAAVSGR